MTLLPAFLRTPGPRRVDGGLILALVANVLLLGAAALAWVTGRPIDLTSPWVLACGAVLLVQTALLAAVARRHGRRAAERLDVESLVEAVGSDGPIRLSLDAVRAESASGARLIHVQRRMAEVLRQVHRSAHDLRQAARELNAGGEQLGHRTERSTKVLRDAAMTLEQITVAVQARAPAALETRTMADRIAAVTRSLKAIDAMTRQNMAVVETSRRIAHTLAQQVAQLEAVLGSFQLGDPPAAPAAAPRTPAGTTASARAKAAEDLSASRRLAAAVIQAAAQPRTAAAARPPATPPEGGSNISHF